MFPRLRARLGRPPRGQSRPHQHVEAAFVHFRACLDEVEQAKASLATAAPGGRAEGVALAEALAAFEMGLRRADDSMPAWRMPEMEEVWQHCAVAVHESARRAEALRLGEAPAGYEQLYAVLADLMDPLEAFGETLGRFRRLGV